MYSRLIGTRVKESGVVRRYGEMTQQGNKRRDSDVLRLYELVSLLELIPCSMRSEFEVKLVEDRLDEITVLLRGPRDSPYELGVWSVRVCFPLNYPFKSPSIVRYPVSARVEVFRGSSTKFSIQTLTKSMSCCSSRFDAI